MPHCFTNCRTGAKSDVTGPATTLKENFGQRWRQRSCVPNRKSQTANDTELQRLQLSRTSRRHGYVKIARLGILDVKNLA